MDDILLVGGDYKLALCNFVDHRFRVAIDNTWREWQELQEADEPIIVKAKEPE